MQFLKPLHVNLPCMLHPNCGQKIFSGYLVQFGFQIQRKRVRNALKTVIIFII